MSEIIDKYAVDHKFLGKLLKHRKDSGLYTLPNPGVPVTTIYSGVRETVLQMD